MILNTLLHYANSNLSILVKQDFYALKERLLDQYAKVDGYDIQEITKKCWGYDDDGCPGITCRKCGGTGIFDRFWVLLQRYRWGKYIFHSPASNRTRIKPCHPVTIHGYVTHKSRGTISNESVLWLFLLCGEWDSLWNLMRGSMKRCGWYLWPLSNIQRIAFYARIYLRLKHCYYCDSLFPTWGHGWTSCKKCRERFSRQESMEDVPF